MRLFHSFAFATACAIAGDQLSAQAAQRGITPVEAINAAAEAATTSERVVRGVFEMPVRATGRQDSLLYLNSELDYRDQRSLTVAITPNAEKALQERFGADLALALTGKRIRVTGAAQRVTIWFFCDGKRTDKYYFQTHVPVLRADQLTVVEGNGASRTQDTPIGDR